MSGLQGRVVMVTGAGGNVGSAVVHRLLAEGVKVAGLDHHQPRPVSSPEQGMEEDMYVGVAADLSNESAVAYAFNQVEEQLGPVWAVLNIAGGWKGGKPVRDTGLDLFESMITVNLRTAFLVSREAMRRMQSRGGRIVLVGSYSSATSTSLSGSGAYNVSKAGVIALTKVLAEEGASAGVFTNAIAPNTIATESNKKAMPKADFSKWVPVEEVVEAALSVASPRSGVNGSVLTLSGAI